ncbi:hypothetical protein OR571_11005 [Psychrobacillus sp. NEAU-3TGS]|uniref:hypothetical protein n=1 Tax=Psychrobacillus sp. NEAU-3TGS TaxID=2995412 RepID=UPI0024989D28|nr:hypothetical protein [Psychrobacillus sp. NEAU-3TGS]MDI2587625.1 hypothetical protein [Psychrobacillus sp. NEAU-3TGS]
MQNKEYAYKLVDKDHFDTIAHIVTELLEVKSLFTQWSSKSNDIEIINKLLAEHISKQTSNLNNEIKLAISQCILKEFSTENNKNFELYKTWIEAVRGGKIR